MSFLNVNKFKGLRQDIAYGELPINHCHTLQNLNVDDPLGMLSIREGYSHKYDIAAFTDIKSAYEYRFEVSSETVVLLNDNGTLKTVTDGAAAASLTLPTGATLEADFQNNYLGYKDHILITTGNGSTNYILWYGYVDREIDDSDGIFNNVLEETGYILTRSQLICPNGTFSNVQSVAYLDPYYYVSFQNSKWIEVRDSNFQLKERFAVNEDENVTAADNGRVSISPNSTTGKLYVGTTGGVYEIDPNTHKVENTNEDYQNILDLCNDETNIFAIGGGTTALAAAIINITIATFNGADDQAIANLRAVSCDQTATSGNVYVGITTNVHQMDKADLTAYDKSNNLAVTVGKIEWKDADQVLVSTASSHVFDLDATDVSSENADNTKVTFPFAFIWVGGTTLRVLDYEYGVIQHFDAYTITNPELIAIACEAYTTAGALQAGSYFYKMAIEDEDGQIHTLSDPITVQIAVSNFQIELKIIATGDRSETDKFTEFYRVKYIHIFRAYNEVVDAETPSTDYKFLKKIDINDAGWTNDSNLDIYYFDYTDNQTETVISTTTYLGMSGTGDTVKPRFINGKYFTWLDDQLHLANFYHDGDNFPSRIIRSADNQPDSFSFYDYYDFEVGDGEEIKGLSNVLGRSIVFKTRKLGVFYNAGLENGYIPGLVSPAGHYKIGDSIFYISDVGLHVYDGRGVQTIHYPVKDYFDDLDTLTDGTVFFFDSKDRVIFSFNSDSTSLVYNIKYNIWMYWVQLDFKGYFKNYENQYIGWNDTRFRKIGDGAVNDSEDYGGGNGSAITINYESPLLRFSKIDGEVGIPISHRHRIMKGSDTVTFYLYEYRNTADGKKSIYTQALGTTPGTSPGMQNYFFGPLVGEAFSIRLGGPIDGGDFEYHGLTLEYMSGGYWYGRT